MLKSSGVDNSLAKKNKTLKRFCFLVVANSDCYQRGSNKVEHFHYYYFIISI